MIVFKSTFKKIKPSSSLVFSDMLKFANKYCKEEEFNNSNQSLCILLIFSHNELLESDIEQTIQQLSIYVEVPFQVINIGIGNQQFQYIQTLLSEENYESRKKFSFIPFENFKSDQAAFCSEIFKTIPKSVLERARNQRIPPLISFENMLSARDYYQKNLTIGHKKTFGCINERPFYEKLTIELGYKVDLIQDIFSNGLEEEDLGLVLDRIGTYSKPSHQHVNSRYHNSKQSDLSVPQQMLLKAKQFYRLKEKFNAHTKKQESKALAIKKQNADNLSPFSFFYKSDQKHDKQEALNPQLIYINKNRLPPNYPESYLDARIHSTNNLLTSEQELNPTKPENSVYNGWRNEDIENNFSFISSPIKIQNSGLLQDSTFKKPLKQNNFLIKWRDAVNQSAKMNNSPMIVAKKQKHVIQGIQCTFCAGDQIQMILMPCGHNCCCQDYLDQFDDQVCPVCRINITQIVKFYDDQEENDDHNISEVQSKRSKSKDKLNPSHSKNELEKNEPQISLHVEKSEILTSIPNRKKDKYSNRKSEIEGNIILKY